MSTQLAFVLSITLVCITVVIIYSIRLYVERYDNNDLYYYKSRNKYLEGKYEAIVELLAKVMNISKNCTDTHVLEKFYEDYLKN